MSRRFGIKYLPYSRQVVDDALQQPEIWCWLIANMILVPHAAAVFATYVRWGALPLGICSGVASFFLTMGIIIASTLVSGSGPPEKEIIYFISSLILAACALGYIVVWRRMITITSQS